MRAATITQSDNRSLDETFELFGVIHKLVDDEEALRIVRAQGLAGFSGRRECDARFSFPLPPIRGGCLL